MTGTRAETTAIHAELDAKLAALVTSDDWRAALDVAARFPRYSPNNVLWLMLQADQRGISLERVAGFKAWQALGRQVRKGETALRVLAPAKYKTTDEKTGEDRWQLRGFTTACVFDISQTDGDDLPDVRPDLLSGDASGLDDVVALIRGAGFTFALVPPNELGSANGTTDHSTRSVVVRDDMSPTQTLKTTVHEYAHVLLHGECGYRADRGRLEIEAESVAYVVLTHAGITPDGYSLPYVAGWATGDLDKIRATTETVITTAHRIITALSERTLAPASA